MKHLLLTTIAAVLLVGTAFAGPIHDAAMSGDLAGIQAELAKGVDVDGLDMNFFMTPLHFAAGYGDKQTVELLIAKGATVNARAAGGTTPLLFAVQLGKKEIVELLIARGADVNAWAVGSGTPLDFAIESEKIEIADLLKRHGGKIATEYSILSAVNSGKVEAVKHHLAAGADVNAKDEYGWTPLHLAAYVGYKETAELLIAGGADVNVDGQFFLTPLDLAVFNGQKEIIEFLRKHGGRTRGEIANGIPYLAYGKWGLSIDGKGGLKYEVLYSADLKQWQVLETITLEASTQIYVDKLAAEQPIRFYRLRLVE
jgi:cytohesin